jgi:hypothetical protein
MSSLTYVLRAQINICLIIIITVVNQKIKNEKE